MKMLVVTNTVVTVLVGWAIAWLVSRGDFLATASHYPVDFIYMVLGVVLAFFVSNFSVNAIQRGSWKISAFIYIIYYYGAFGLFADGHLADWSHSDGFIDKLLMSGLYIVISLFSVVVPLILIGISIVQAYLLSISVENRQI
ncbi:hypothetical protein L4C36_07665 [Photobacterium japonica]|uniref:hypothetical protein n=1 Tax=Photobacterium japonica TaxID=2910235 RepID=UPI003D0B8841